MSVIKKGKRLHTPLHQFLLSLDENQQSSGWVASISKYHHIDQACISEEN